jgi:hypothetical protein
MTTEKILAHAEMAAIYFRALVDKGVPAQAAVQLTCSYVGSVVISQAGNEGPREPWQDP